MIRKNGFTLIEVVVSVFLLGTLLSLFTAIYSNVLIHNAGTRELERLNNVLRDKIESTQSLGFWVWDGDSINSYPTAHRLTEWTTRLNTLGYSGRAVMDTVFLKEESGDFVPFSGDNFDGDFPRDNVRVTFSVYTSKGGGISQEINLVLLPSISHAWAQLYIIKTGLALYAEANSGSYPATGTWDTDLVSTYLDEIPNDPFTTEQEKTTHIEESIDWFYENNSGVITVSAQSHRSTVTITF